MCIYIVSNFSVWSDELNLLAQMQVKAANLGDESSASPGPRDADLPGPPVGENHTLKQYSNKAGEEEGKSMFIQYTPWTFPTIFSHNKTREVSEFFVRSQSVF